jgi:hypothetical protein
MSTWRHVHTRLSSKGMTAPQFRAALRRLDLSQRRLALLLKMDPKTTNRWARGTSPIPEYIPLLFACWRREGVPR